MSTQLIRPAALSRAARARLVDELFEFQSRSCARVDRAAFERSVFAPVSDASWIRVERDGRGSCVGYRASHFLRVRISGREVGVLHSVNGGAGPSLRSSLRDLWRARLAHPGLPLYGFACLSHPRWFEKLTNYFDAMLPGLAGSVPAEDLELMAALGDRFGLEPAGRDPLVRRVGWRPRESLAERQYWLRRQEPSVRLFVRRNPSYSSGEGLLVLIPATVSVLATAVGRRLFERAAEGAKSLMGRALEAAGLEARTQRRRRRAALLEHPWLSLVRSEVFERLVDISDEVVFDDGACLLREGGKADALYMVVDGSVHLRSRCAGGPRIVAQLGAGEVFGGAASLTGRPQATSVRAVGRLRVLRFDRGPLLELMRDSRRLSRRIWRRVGEGGLEGQLPLRAGSPPGEPPQALSAVA